MSVELRQFSGSSLPESRQRKRAFMAESVKLGSTVMSSKYGVMRTEATNRSIAQMAGTFRLGGSVTMLSEEDPRDTVIYDIDKRGLPSTRNLRLTGTTS